MREVYVVLEGGWEPWVAAVYDNEAEARKHVAALIKQNEAEARKHVAALIVDRCSPAYATMEKLPLRKKFAQDGHDDVVIAP